MQIFVFALVAVITVFAANAQPLDGSGVPLSNRICEPGKYFKRYCNTCLCPEDGLRETAVCTLMECPGVWSENGIQLSPSEPLAVLKSRTKRQVCMLGAYYSTPNFMVCTCVGNPANWVCS